MSTIRPLESYVDATGQPVLNDERVLEATKSVAGLEWGKRWQDLLPAAGVKASPEELLKGRADVVELLPDDCVDPAFAWLIYNPYANTADPNSAGQAFQLSRVSVRFADMVPSRAYIVANPSGPFRYAGRVPFADMRDITKGDFSSVVGSSLERLEKDGIERVIPIGGSFGAELALTAAARAKEYGIAVPHVVTMNNTSPEKRSLLDLLQRFALSGAGLDEYVQATGVPTFIQAWEDSGRLVDAAFKFLRPTNIAEGWGLRHGRTEERAHAVLEANEDTRVSAIWGSEDVLAVDGLTKSIFGDLAQDFPGRVRSVRLQGERHAWINDPRLVAGIAVQSVINPIYDSN